MNTKTLSRLLFVAFLGVGVLGLGGCYGIVSFGREIAKSNPEYAYCFLPWVIFLALFALPCFLAVYFALRISLDLGNGRAFTKENVRRLKIVSRMAFFDALYFFIGNNVFLFLNMSHPGILLLALFVVFVGMVIALLAEALSQLTFGAQGLKEENDLTI